MIRLNKQLFWDVDPKKLDLKKHTDFIVGRILEYGDKPEVKWMFDNYEKSQIKKTLLEKRGISRKSANYWALILDVPKDKILCLNKQSQSELQKTWPY